MTETTCQLDNTISLPILVVVCVALLTNGSTFRLSKQALLREVVTGAMFTLSSRRSRLYIHNRGHKMGQSTGLSWNSWHFLFHWWTLGWTWSRTRSQSSHLFPQTQLTAFCFYPRNLKISTQSFEQPSLIHIHVTILPILSNVHALVSRFWWVSNQTLLILRCSSNCIQQLPWGVSNRTSHMLPLSRTVAPWSCRRTNRNLNKLTLNVLLSAASLVVQDIIIMRIKTNK